MIPSAVLPGKTVLGNYEIREVLGQGGGGISYLAYDRSLQREVVIKEHFPIGLCRRTINSAEVLPEDAELYARSLSVFCKEARILAGLNHPNVVKVHDIFEGTGTAYLVMEYIEGRTLKEYLPLHANNSDNTSAILEQLLRTLHYLHHNCVVHRDIKPSNIIIRDNGQPVIIDFGSAHLGTIDHTLTPVGSPGFAAPEQFSPGGRVGAWSDIFALAHCFLHLIPEKQKQHYNPKFLKSLQKAAAAEIADRYADAEEWLRELSPTHRKKKIRLLSLLALVCCLLGLFFGGLGLYLLFQQQQPQQEISLATAPVVQLQPTEKTLLPLPQLPMSPTDAEVPAKMPMGTLMYPVENPPNVSEEALFSNDSAPRDAATLQQFRSLQAEYRQKFKDYCQYARQHHIPMSTQRVYLQQLTETYRHNLRILAE